MKQLYILFTSVLLSTAAFSQTDTLPGYLQDPNIPAFSIQLADGSWYNKSDLEKKPTLILYFSPDCGHCQLETEDILSHAKELNKLQIVMITSREMSEMKTFSDRYMLQKFPFIKIGSDTKKFVTHFYNVKFTPFSALYNKKGQLVKVYEKGIDFDDLEANIK